MATLCYTVDVLGPWRLESNMDFCVVRTKAAKEKENWSDSFTESGLKFNILKRNQRIQWLAVMNNVWSNWNTFLRWTLEGNKVKLKGFFFWGQQHLNGYKILLNEQHKDGIASVLYDARVAVVKCAFSTLFPLSKGQFTAMAMSVCFARC